MEISQCDNLQEFEGWIYEKVVGFPVHPLYRNKNIIINGPIHLYNRCYKRK